MNKPHFTVVIPAHNCAPWARRNLRSALTQKYDNYQVMYTDDASSDDTNKIICETIEELRQLGYETSFELITNRTNKRALANLYNMIVNAHPDTIIVTLDGDDWFPHNEVLTNLSKKYNLDTWITAGSYIINTTLEIVSPKIDEHFWEGNIRQKQHWPFSHLRSFRRWLFMRIKKEDLLDADGDFFKFTFDRAMMYPMIEMAAKRHYKSIQESLYVYNRENPQAVDKVPETRVQQLRIEKILREKKPYLEL